MQDHERYTCNGSVDIRGHSASKKHTGKWRACYSILDGEFCGAMGYYGLGYLSMVQKKSNVAAASNIASWQGTCYLTPLLGAFLADSYWGRHRTIVISLTMFTIGMVLLTLSAVIPASMHTRVISPQEFLSSLGLFLTALGLGGMWPCVPTFGADQFDDTDRAEKVQKELYYNWYYFTVNGSFFLASTLLVWVQDNCGWGWGFGIPTLFSAIGIAGFLACMKLYRYQKPGGSALTRICQVVVAATRKLHVDVPDDSSLLYELSAKESAISILLSTFRCNFSASIFFLYFSDKLTTFAFRFFDRAATITSSVEKFLDTPNPWKLCTVTQVEELKILARILPVLLTGIIFNTAETLFPLFIEQGEVMDNYIHGFFIPPATLTTFNCLCILILAPSYNKVLVPILSRITGINRGLSELQRIGVGMVFAMLALVSAALVEMVRLDIATKRGLVHRNSAVPLSILWQGPQYFFVGVAKVFTVVGFIEFAYKQSPDAIRSLCQACPLIMMTLGSYLVSIMLKFINSVTRKRGSHGWIPENLNEGRLDQFFWLMAGLQLLNVLALVYCATRFRRKLGT
ncbi:Protein NRT1/ PTR FAMILY 8.3 [Dichanthelium oligosanthes]|uniref:Protein NRT1/ PTR FAMILY 8.3 n=1 Tax=Dichanthelium oligosanthes TaxID=888268 RepID=A0A1E5UMY9_9POAL|nr:Protein NRT1/ PTR FAMILY 8.3 [Dichanthelium oligosanthes]